MTPAALNREQAAEYVGVSPNSFDKLVCAGRMPKARTYAPDVERIVWLRSELDEALNELRTHAAKARPYEGVEL
jgi:predicted DNA-binding transcriptional regulator AlpA